MCVEPFIDQLRTKKGHLQVFHHPKKLWSNMVEPAGKV